MYIPKYTAFYPLVGQVFQVNVYISIIKIKNDVYTKRVFKELKLLVR